MIPWALGFHRHALHTDDKVNTTYIICICYIFGSVFERTYAYFTCIQYGECLLMSCHALTLAHYISAFAWKGLRHVFRLLVHPCPCKVCFHNIFQKTNRIWTKLFGLIKNGMSMNWLDFGVKPFKTLMYRDQI